MHVNLLHDIVLVPGPPQSLWALGGLGIFLAFSCYRETLLGGTGRQVHTESSTDREDTEP